MKKIVALMLCVCMMWSVSAVQADEVDLIPGLSENLDELWLRNHVSQEEMDSMLQEWQNWFTEKFWETPWEDRQSVEWRLIPKDATAEEVLAKRLRDWEPDFQNGYLVTCLNTRLKYAKQYMQNGCFDYLFSETQYWGIPSDSGTKVFSVEGNLISNIITLETADSVPVTISPDSIQYLNNKNNLSQKLQLLGEEKVNGLKLLGHYMDFFLLFVDGQNDDYLVRLDGYGPVGYTGVDSVDKIEKHHIYKLSETILILESMLEIDGYVHGGVIADNVVAEKAVFEDEAVSLQAEGLLRGNENGLDLLKPLTRIEAATMLLRAIGEQETAPDSGVQTFFDVSADHWGYGAAERAASIGMVQGIGDGQFAPDRTVSATEFATMLLRAAETEAFDWEQAMDILIEDGIISEEDSKGMDFFTRGDMAKIIYEARAKGLL